MFGEVPVTMRLDASPKCFPPAIGDEKAPGGRKTGGALFSIGAIPIGAVLITPSGFAQAPWGEVGEVGDVAWFQAVQCRPKSPNVTCAEAPAG